MNLQNWLKDESCCQRMAAPWESVPNGKGKSTVARGRFLTPPLFARQKTADQPKQNNLAGLRNRLKGRAA